VALTSSAPGSDARGFFTARDGEMTFDARLLDVLVCPKCKGSLEHDQPGSRLVCRTCCLAYPISDGIPIMLETEAERLEK